MKYQTPKNYYHRLHHIRPRFKNDIETVLIYMATEIAKIEHQKKDKFAEAVNDAIRKFPGNITKTDKTINNWRTEISSLFGFIQTSKTKKESWAGLRAVELADKQDLVHSFKAFLYDFQYPGGHLKPHESAEFIKKGIRFKPAKFILELLSLAEKEEGKRIGINSAELTHCVFNDLRVTRDGEKPKNTWKHIKENRDGNVDYDWTGDVIRYAGDILDYMEIANLLVSHGSQFFINKLEQAAINKFVSSEEWFEEYDRYINKRKVNIEQVKKLQKDWFAYVNQQREEGFFDTDILALISKDTEEYENLRKKVLEGFADRLEKPTEIGAKEIGDVGESLIYGHECMRIKLGGREESIHLIKCIPNQFAMGYDIKSIELDTTQRYIEVKTTISSKQLDFSRVHLTPVEWTAAESLNGRYFIYRLFLSKKAKSLFLLRDPVGQYKANKLKMVPRDGADIMFDKNKCGTYERLLEWES